MYVLDRTTGEVLSADPYGHITTQPGRGPRDRPPP